MLRMLQAPCATARARPARQRAVRQHVYASSSLQTFLDDCAKSKLGKVRFIVLGDGAILESVSSFNRVKYTDVPGRGMLATISTEDKAFECHITLSKVKEVKMAKSKAKAGDYDIFATRFCGEEGKVLMSCILHGSQGVYDPESVQAWQQLQAQYGDSIKF